MASFTDKPIPLAPYVEQLPLQAMVGVGEQLQERYNQGVQKIQSSIDNMAGLDIMRPVDKNYMQSLLNNLGNNLKTVAAGDFSNYQLVNSVSGMVGTIGKDVNVQNAVASTAWYKKQLVQMQEDVKNGKANPANDYDFSVKSNAWLSSNSPGEKFSSSYQTPIDYTKKWTDALAKIHSNLTSQDILNSMDSNGKINSGKLALAMTRTKTEGVSAKQIENVIYATMGPEDINQLAIEGRYRFKDATPAQLQNHIRMTNASYVASIDKQISKLTEYAKVNVSNTDEYNRTTESIQDLKDKRDKLISSLPQSLVDAEKNPDEARYQLYRDGAVSGFTDAFSWEHKVLEHMTDPAFEAQIQLDNLALRRQEVGLQAKGLSWKEYIDTQNLKNDQIRLDIERAKGGIRPGYTEYMGISTDVKDPLVAMRKDVSNNIVARYAKAEGISIVAVENALKNYPNNKNAIDAAWRSKMDEVIQYRDDARATADAIAKTRKEIWTDPNFTGKDESDIEKELSHRLLKHTEYIPQAIELPALTEATRKGMEDLASLALSVYNSPGSTPGGSKELSHKDVTKLQDWLTGTGKNDILYRKLVQGERTWLIMQKGTDEKLIPLTPNLAAQLPRNLSEPTDEDIRLDRRIRLGDGSTNPSGNPENSYFKPSSFPKTKRESVAVDLKQVEGRPGLKLITLRLKLANRWIHTQVDDYPMDLDNIKSWIGNLTDKKVLDIFLKSGPEDAKEEIAEELKNI